MHSLELFPLAYWSSFAKTIISFYTLFLVFEVLVMLLALYSWSFLPRRFRIMAAGCVGFISVGFVICISFLVTLNTQSECTIGRKVAYSFFYLGFFIYDIYQLQKILAITSAGKTSTVILHFLVVVRFASYIYNIYSVLGVLTYSHLYLDGRAGCTSSFLPVSIYQEHIVSILFELSLLSQFTVFVFSNRTHAVPLTAFLNSVVDYETVSFLAYLLFEIMYTVTYMLMPGSYISLLNTFYLNVPVGLFLFNVCILRYSQTVIGTRSELRRSITV